MDESKARRILGTAIADNWPAMPPAIQQTVRAAMNRQQLEALAWLHTDNRAALLATEAPPPAPPPAAKPLQAVPTVASRFERLQVQKRQFRPRTLRLQAEPPDPEPTDSAPFTESVLRDLIAGLSEPDEPDPVSPDAREFVLQHAQAGPLNDDHLSALWTAVHSLPYHVARPAVMRAISGLRADGLIRWNGYRIALAGAEYD